MSETAANVSEATQAETDDLRAMSRGLATAEQSPWEPRCVVRAFGRPRRGEIPPLTMGGWLVLEEARSPLLINAPLAEDDDARTAQMQLLQAIFGVEFAGLSGEEIVDVVDAIQEEINAGFAMLLKLDPPEGYEIASGDDGFGLWLPVYTRLVCDCHMSDEQAMSYAVRKAFALIAARLCQHGWRVAGQKYRLRDTVEREEEAHRV